MSNELTKTAKSWTLDTTNLTDEQKAVIEAVRFPSYVKPGNVLQKRIRRRSAGGVFIDKEVLGMADYKYLTCDYNLAKIDMIKNHLPKDASGRNLTGKALAAGKAHLEKTQKAKSYKHEYFDATAVQQELENLFATFCTPVPSRSMAVDAAEEEVASTAIEAPKSLSNQDKGKAKKMYKDEGKDATEIAEALGVEKSRVIEYLKTV